MEDYKKLYKQTQRKMKEFIKRWDGIKLSSNDLFTEELKQIVEIENEDERVRKKIIETFKILGDGKMPVDINYADIFTWLEKQGETSTILSNSSNIGNVTLSEEEQNRFAKCVLTSCASSFIDYLDAHKYEGKMCVSNGECEDIENAFHNAMWDRLHRYYCKYIEKQGEQKQKQYDIDILEKHITKDSISELAHTVIVRNGWEIVDAKEQKTAWSEKQGEEKIFDKAESMKHSYITTNSEFFQWIYDRLKYVYNENPNVDYMLSLKERIEDMQKFANKIEPEFKVGDWVIRSIKNEKRIGTVTEILPEHYIINFDGWREQIPIIYGDCIDIRLWTIQDAKDGDILATDDGICIFDGTVEEGKYPFAYCGITERGFGSYDVKLPFSHDNNVHPATKEQRDTLLKAMADAGYEWDSEKKELKEIDPKPYGQRKECLDCQFNYAGECKGSCQMKRGEQKPNLYFKAKDWYVSKVDGKIHNIYNSVDKIEPKFHEGDIIQFNGFGHNRYTIKNVCGLSHYINTIGEKMDMSYTDANFEVIKDSDKNKLCRAWSEEDDYNVQCLVAKANCDIQKGNVGRNEELIDWLKSLRNRVKPQPDMVEALRTEYEKGRADVISEMKSSWSEEDETNSYHLKTLFENLAKNIKHEFRIISDNDRDKYTTWLESIKERYTWKPSEEQMKVLDEVLNFAANHESPYWNYYIFETLNNLIRQLKKLKGE